MNITFFKWAVVIALVTSIASLAGLLHNKEAVAQAECRRQSERQRDSALAQIELDRSIATLNHDQRLLACRLENVSNQSAIDQCLSQENTRFSQELQDLAARSVAAETAFTARNEGCNSVTVGGQPAVTADVPIEIDCIESGAFVCFKDVPGLCQKVFGSCRDCWRTFCPDQIWEFSSDTPMSVALVAGSLPGKNARFLVTPGPRGRRVSLAAPRDFKLEKDETLWVVFEFDQKSASRRVMLHWRTRR